MSTLLVVGRATPSLQRIARESELDGCRAVQVADCALALNQPEREDIGLLVVDLLTLERHGTAFLPEWRRQRPEVPVLVLAGQSREGERLRGFRLGVDAFLVEPVPAAELFGAVRRLLRTPVAKQRTIPEAPQTTIRFSDIEVMPATHTVTRSGQPVPLRYLEFQLLMGLIERAGNVVTRSELLRDVWGYSSCAVSRTVDAHVGSLRRKLEDRPDHPKHILTVRKVGYRFSSSRDPGICRPGQIATCSPQRRKVAEVFAESSSQELW